VFLWDNQVRRFFSSSADHAHAPWFYLPVLFEVLLPWAIFVVPAAVRMARPGGPNTGVDYRRQYLIAVTIAPLILLSAASGKRHLYLLPLLPGFSVMLAVWLAEAWSTADMRWEEMWRRWGSVLFALLPCAAWGSAFYLAAARGHVMAVTAAGVVGSVSAGGVALVYIFRRGRAASPWLMVGLLAAAYAAALSPSPWKMIEQEKGAASLREMLTAHVGRNDTLSGYTPSERVQGIVAFSRRATFPMLWTPVELDAVLGASRSNVVLIPERDYRELREHGLTRAPAKVIASCALGRRRQALLRGRGPG
jgi:4-amino-4-deoxy-L-arabinose transferase-like glycosyltransferase